MMTLYLLSEPNLEFSFVKQTELAQGVFKILLFVDKVNFVEAVMKQKKRYRLKPNIKEEVAKSLIGRETALHSYLFRSVPENIVPLLFANPGEFTYIKSKEFFIPVKVTVFCKPNFSRVDIKLAQSNKKVAIERVLGAMKLYENDKLCSNTDWSQTRNVLYCEGKCLFHDFDSSVHM